MRPSARASAAPPRPQWLGRLSYRWAWRLQASRRQAVIEGRAPEALWLLEHDPVVTIGRRHAVVQPARGVEVVKTERGGLATWHGPGQLVGYLVLDVGGRGLTVRGTVEAIEAGVIAWLAGLGVAAHRRAPHPGVWVGTDKICALGLHFRRGVSMHGFALNLTCGPDGYAGFVPCGIADAGVTSVAALSDRAPEPWQAASSVGCSIIDAIFDTACPHDYRDEAEGT